MIHDENYKYKGFYYFYDSENGIWKLFDNYIIGNVWIFNAKYYRLDECFDLIKFKLEEFYGKYNR